MQGTLTVVKDGLYGDWFIVRNDICEAIYCNSRSFGIDAEKEIYTEDFRHNEDFKAWHGERFVEMFSTAALDGITLNDEQLKRVARRKFDQMTAAINLGQRRNQQDLRKALGIYP